MSFTKPTKRRGFLSTVAKTFTAVGAASLLPSFNMQTSALQLDKTDNPVDAEAWFDKLKGKHRMLFDATQARGMLTFTWARIFLMTNGTNGAASDDNGAVIVLRNDAVPFAYNDAMWSKYGLGDWFKVNDPKTNVPSLRNPFAQPAKGEYAFPGLGEVLVGINELQESGVMIGVCNVAATVRSAMIADKMKLDAAEVKKDWDANRLPGIQVLPSGVWAVNRAQEHGCSYCFVG